MPPRPDPNLDKADLHHRRARQFRDLAQVILEASPITGEYTDILVDTAGALMYEAAKQWVNAVANLRGHDPQTNQEKLAELRDIEAGHANDGSKLIYGARAAWHLHVNADQSQLMRREFDLYFSATVLFADEMSAIYHSTQQDQ